MDAGRAAASHLRWLRRLCVSAGSVLSVVQMADTGGPGQPSVAEWVQGMLPLLRGLGAGLQEAAADNGVVASAVEAANAWAAETGTPWQAAATVAWPALHPRLAVPSLQRRALSTVAAALRARPAAAQHVSVPGRAPSWAGA